MTEISIRIDQASKIKRGLENLASAVRNSNLGQEEKMVNIVAGAEQLASDLVSINPMMAGKPVLGIKLGFVDVDFKAGYTTFNLGEMQKTTRIEPFHPGYSGLEGVYLSWNGINKIIQEKSGQKVNPIANPLANV